MRLLRSSLRASTAVRCPRLAMRNSRASGVGGSRLEVKIKPQAVRLDAARPQERRDRESFAIARPFGHGLRMNRVRP
jgi:hypothetical protein